MGRLVFGQDMIPQINHIANCRHMCHQKNTLIEKHLIHKKTTQID